MNVPGPGAYRIPSSIGDVPNYAMPNRSDESKYIWYFSFSLMTQKYKVNLSA